MVHLNQHIVVALHLVVGMNVWLLYDLNGVEPKRLLLFYCFKQLSDVHQ